MIKLAVVAVVINDEEIVERFNAILHEYRKIIIGRMGLPLTRRGISMISLMVEGREDEINSLSGRLGMLPDVSVKTAYSRVSFEE